MIHLNLKENKHNNMTEKWKKNVRENRQKHHVQYCQRIYQVLKLLRGESQIVQHHPGGTNCEDKSLSELFCQNPSFYALFERAAPNDYEPI